MLMENFLVALQAVAAAYPVGEFLAIVCRCLFPDPMSRIEKYITIVRKPIRQELPVARRNDGIIPSSDD